MRTFVLKIKVDESKKEFTMESENDGFSSFELLGLIEYKRDDIARQIRGEIEPDTVSRKCVEESQH